jgi:hypothetical protein
MASIEEILGTHSNINIKPIPNLKEKSKSATNVLVDESVFACLNDSQEEIRMSVEGLDFDALIKKNPFGNDDRPSTVKAIHSADGKSDKSESLTPTNTSTRGSREEIEAKADRFLKKFSRAQTLPGSPIKRSKFYYESDKNDKSGSAPSMSNS